MDKKSIRRAGALLTVATAALLTGCGGDPVVARWERDEKVPGTDTYEDEMELFDDGTGTALYTYIETVDGLRQSFRFTFEIDWEQRREAEYELRSECRTASYTLSYDGESATESGCGAVENLLEISLDRDLDCELTADEQELDCDVGSVVNTYVLVGQ